MAAATNYQMDHSECAICLTDMMDRHPRALVCLHSFCQDCAKPLIQKKLEESFIICPTCRRKTIVPEGRVGNLTENFLLKSMHSGQDKSTKSSKVCISCMQSNTSRQGEATYHCNDCNFSLCLMCKISHEKRFKRPHNIVSTKRQIQWISKEDAKANREAENAVCKLHKSSDIQYWCQKCQDILCPLCAVHKSHDDHIIEDITEFLNPKIEKITAEIQEKLERTENHHSKLVELQNVIDKVIGIRERVIETGDIMKAVINSQVDELVRKCDVEYIQPSQQKVNEINVNLYHLQNLREHLPKLRTLDSLSWVHKSLPEIEQELAKVIEIPDLDKAVITPDYQEGTKHEDVSLGQIVKCPVVQTEEKAALEEGETPQDDQATAAESNTTEEDTEKGDQSIASDTTDTNTQNQKADINYRQNEPKFHFVERRRVKTGDTNIQCLDITPDGLCVLANENQWFLVQIGNPPFTIFKSPKCTESSQSICSVVILQPCIYIFLTSGDVFTYKSKPCQLQRVIKFPVPDVSEIINGVVTRNRAIYRLDSCGNVYKYLDKFVQGLNNPTCLATGKLGQETLILVAHQMGKAINAYTETGNLFLCVSPRDAGIITEIALANDRIFVLNQEDNCVPSIAQVNLQPPSLCKCISLQGSKDDFVPLAYTSNHIWVICNGFLEKYCVVDS